MKYFIYKIYAISFLITILLIQPAVSSKIVKNQYKSENLTNYFSGILAASKHDNEKAFRYLKEAQSLKNKHYNFNIEFVRTLVLLEKFDKAIEFSESIWREDQLFFEADLLLGLNFFLKKDYEKAKKYFERLNEISKYNIFFEDFIGNVLLAWNKASQGHKEDSFKYLEKIPKPYRHLERIQNTFLKCYFNEPETVKIYKEIIQDKDYNFLRYNFFLTNYFLHKNNNSEAKKIINQNKNENDTNLLLKETKDFLLLTTLYPTVSESSFL